MTTWRSVLAAQFFAPEFWSRRERRSGLCGAICRSPTKWRASGAHDPEKWRPVFGPRSCATKKGKRSAERRIVLPMSAISAAYALFPARPPFGAHACGTRHRLLPRWLSSRTGFPAAAADGCFTRFANQRKKIAAVKHAPCGPVFVPVDRGPKAARERSLLNSARGHRISLSSIRRHRLTSLKNERGDRVYCHRCGKVKAL